MNGMLVERVVVVEGREDLGGDLTSTTSPGRRGRSPAEFAVPTGISYSSVGSGFKALQ